MSKPKYKWYGDVKRRIMDGDWKQPESFQQYLYMKAIYEAKGETQKLPNGEMRLKAIDCILINQTDTYISFAMKNYYEKTIIQRWINSFVNLVGKKVGY